MDKQQIFWNEIENWDKETFSVFLSGSTGPILDRLSRESRSSSVIDLGTGPGYFLSYLAEYFDSVCALDYAPNLVKKARALNKQYPNIQYLCGDMRFLPLASSTFNIVLSINSILPNSINETDIFITEIFRILKPGGVFVGVLPSFETIIYLYLLKYEALRKNRMTHQKALKIVEKEMEQHHFHPLGIYSDYPGAVPHKYFYLTEIQYLFLKAGFVNIRIEKLEYSWEYCRDHFYGYFPLTPKIWDWFVVAHKNK